MNAATAVVAASAGSGVQSSSPSVMRPHLASRPARTPASGTTAARTEGRARRAVVFFLEVSVKRVFRWVGFLLVVLLAFAAVGFGVAVVASNRALDQRVAVLPPAPVLGRGSVERGKHIYTAVSSCVVCHNGDAGGGPFITDAAMAVLNAPNLTRGNGGVGAQYTDADLDRAIRRGIRPDGTRLLIMPSWDYAALSNDDAASVIAYIRSLPPVDRVNAARAARPRRPRPRRDEQDPVRRRRASRTKARRPRRRRR